LALMTNLFFSLPTYTAKKPLGTSYGGDSSAGRSTSSDSSNSLLDEPERPLRESDDRLRLRVAGLCISSVETKFWYDVDWLEFAILCCNLRTARCIFSDTLLPLADVMIPAQPDDPDPKLQSSARLRKVTQFLEFKVNL
jgi:hypothetical protein